MWVAGKECDDSEERRKRGAVFAGREVFASAGDKMKSSWKLREVLGDGRMRRAFGHAGRQAGQLTAGSLLANNV